MREAPSRVIIKELLARGARIQAFDPVAHEEAKRIFKGTACLEIDHLDQYAVLKGADALMVVTEWKMFRSVQISEIKAAMQGNIIIDGRNIFNPENVRSHDMIYHGIGRV